MSLILACEFNPLLPGEPSPGITFWEGNDATQDPICTLSMPINTVDSFVYKFKSDTSTCENDEAHSLVLHVVNAGLTVCIYDDPDCVRDDSTTKIVVKTNLTSKIIGSFETEILDPDVDVDLFRGGNLDGKVSCIVVGYAECP